MLSEQQASVVADGAEVVAGGCEQNHLLLVGPAHLVWARSMEVADQFEESHVFVVVLELLRTAAHDADVVENAVALACSHIGEHPRDLVAWRALGLLKRALVFLGGARRGRR